MIKFRTPLLAIMFKVDAQGMPKELRSQAEHELHNLVNMFSAIWLSPDQRMHDAFINKMQEFSKEFIVALAEEIKAAAEGEQTAQACDDWKRGLRTVHGRCTNCNGKH